MNYTNEFLKEMPKTDLHLHLDGSIRLESMVEMARNSKLELPASTPEGLKEQVYKEKYANLGEYLRGFQYTCSILRDMENLERAAYELAWDNINEGVSYIEPRFAPQLLMDPEKGIEMEEILVRVNNGLKRAQTEYNNSDAVKKDGLPGFHYGIICCAMRAFGPNGYSPYYTNFFSSLKYLKSSQVIAMAAMELARASVSLRDNKGLPIVSIDLAGQEEGYPANNFREAYEYVHKNFMHKTVHAGEAYGAESIFQAITECHADRIGHGYSLFMPERILDPSITDRNRYIKNLASFIADRRTVIEVCLTSNMQTNPEIKTLKEHKFKDMLENRMAVSICTDNRLVSNTTVTNEYRLAVDNFDIPLKRLKDIVAYGFKKSFFPGSYVEKRQYAKTAMEYFDKVAAKHGVTK
ncbi:MAG: adenosine deaminase family protein [Bacteriovoracaceae bacterium]|nr:adenosine deaminase family protein [Bacteriovoracaceae bacterium]